MILGKTGGERCEISTRARDRSHSLIYFPCWDWATDILLLYFGLRFPLVSLRLFFLPALSTSEEDGTYARSRLLWPFHLAASPRCPAGVSRSSRFDRLSTRLIVKPPYSEHQGANRGALFFSVHCSSYIRAQDTLFSEWSALPQRSCWEHCPPLQCGPLRSHAAWTINVQSPRLAVRVSTSGYDWTKCSG